LQSRVSVIEGLLLCDGRDSSVATLMSSTIVSHRSLLQNGATVNRLSTIGGTALMHATQWRRVDVVKALLLHGGDANLPPSQRVCPYTTIVSSCQQYV
jgi:ankyrin repeat protein